MIRYFALHPTAANLLMAALLASGLLSLGSLRRETFPDVTPTQVQVRAPYPGATAEEIEEVVCQRVEDALDGVLFVKELTSDAREGVGVVAAEMDDAGDYATFLSDIEAKVGAIDDFPEDVEEPVVSQLGTTDPVLTLVVAGPMEPRDLKAHCEDVKRRLQRLPGVSLVRVAGFSDHQLRISLSSEALLRYGLSAAAVADVVARQSLASPSGTLETKDRDILLRFADERRTTQELAELVVSELPGGGQVRLGEIATIDDRFEDPEQRVEYGGRRAGLLLVEKTKSQDVIRVAAAVKQFVEAERARNPQVELLVTQDMSTLVVERLRLLVSNGWQGMTLVFLSLWLFFSFKLSFWVAMSLPVSFLGAFFVMSQVDLTVNMLSMVGLLLGLGILMDDGIVIAENIAEHLSRGKTPMQAAVDGVSEVAAGVASSFLTTVCVLGPLAFIQGDIGKVLKVVPMVLILVLSVSLIEAFMILPAHLGHSLRPHRAGAAARFRRAFDRGFDFLRSDVLGPSVTWAVRNRYFTVSAVVGALLATVGLLAGGVVKLQAFPELDGDVLVARVLLPPGAPLERTEHVVERLSDALQRVNASFAPRQPAGEALVQDFYVQFGENADVLESGPHAATLFVDLLGAERRDATIDEIIEAWRSEAGALPDVLELVFSEPSFGPAGRPIEFRLQGDDLAQLEVAAEETKAWLAQFAGVRSLSDDLRPGKTELTIRLRQGALGAGLDAATAARQLRVAFQGATADEIQIGPEAYEIVVQLREDDRNTLADLESFYFTLPSGEFAPLKAIAEAHRGRSWSRIGRVDGVRTVTVRGDVDTRRANTASIVALMRTELAPELARRHAGVTLAFEGEAKEGRVTQQSILRALLIGLLGVFVLLSFQFRSYLEPLTVMAAIPLTLIGVVWGHWALGVDLSMPSILGFASLAGIAVNDSILLVLFLKEQRDRGADVLQACGEASRLRFRAILLTSLTTIAGLLPLLAERSLQAQVLIPLAASIAFGLMASTLLVLFVVPCLYAIFADLGWTRPPRSGAADFPAPSELSATSLRTEG